MSGEKAVCSYGPACYRLNAEHFRQLSHPHLDALQRRMSDAKTTDLPADLGFDCVNRSLLRVQLKTLQAAEHTKAEPAERARPNPLGKADDTVKMRQMSRSQTLAMMSACGEAPDYVPQAGKFAEKHEKAAPYFIFFAAVQKAKSTWNQDRSVTLSELLDRSVGKLTSSLHINFVVDIGWLCAQYMIAEQKADMLVFYGEMTEECPLPPNIEIHKITCRNKFGCHHSKLSILQYEDDGIRVIVSTANLYKDDWDFRSQGLWMSPHLPRLPITANAKAGESKTGFKQELLRYLDLYSNEMERWRAIVKRTDFSAVNVALVFSAPGQYRTGPEQDRWGHRRLARYLTEHAEIPKDEPRSTIVAQGSSMGNLGPTYDAWLGSQIGNSMAKSANGNVDFDMNVIFPTIENYKKSYDMREASNCLCYSESGHLKQRWLEGHLRQWVANRSDRSSAVPHIKTFTRISHDETKIWWFVLGSANLSKAAWGYRNGGTITVLNYETSVVFLPKFVTGTTSFPIKPSSESTTPTFPILYDLPLTPYGKNDKPFVSEFFQKGEKVFSNITDMNN